MVLLKGLLCCLRYCKSTIFQANHNNSSDSNSFGVLFAILQKYDFSSKSQPPNSHFVAPVGCLRYCKSTIFQANHNAAVSRNSVVWVVCDTAKVRFFKQITTVSAQKCFLESCLRYCKSTIFQANHNQTKIGTIHEYVVCDTAKVRFFKQITTGRIAPSWCTLLFAILQKYDFSSKSQRICRPVVEVGGCLRYCKSTIFQANHNAVTIRPLTRSVVCDTAKVRFFKQITTDMKVIKTNTRLFAILQKYDFSSKSQQRAMLGAYPFVVCDTAKVRFFKQITTAFAVILELRLLFAILQKYDFSSKSQLSSRHTFTSPSCLRYCKSTIFQANHN